MTQARKIVLQSMKRDLKALVDRGPVVSTAFSDIKITKQVIVVGGRRVIEASYLAEILNASRAMQSMIHDQRVKHAAERIKRYAAGGKIVER